MTALTLPPGHYQLRASAVSQALGRGGSVYLPIEVPDFIRSRTALGDLIVGRTTRPSAPVARTSLAEHLVPFHPTLDRVFTRGDVLRVAAPPGSQTTLVSQVVELVDLTDTTVATAKAQVGTLSGDASMEPVRFIEALVPLERLSPGAYRLRPE